MKRLVRSILFLVASALIICGSLKANTLASPGPRSPNMGNPVVPGALANPSVHFFNNTWYIYSSSTNNESSNPIVVFKSTDMKNWTTVASYITNYSGRLWAPAVAYANGKYYMYYSHEYNGMYVAEATSPEGPWTEKAMLYNDYGWFPWDCQEIDPQPFQDTDGTWYLYFGNGVARVAKLNPDMISFAETPRVITPPNYTEGPFMIKRNGYYMLMYSGGQYFDDTYNVRYAVSNNPYGPFTEGTNSPILKTNNTNTYGPGHHSIFTKDGVDYIAYHKHYIPTEFGIYATVLICFDRITINSNGTIDTVIPTDEGIPGWGWRFDDNIARGKTYYSASSYADSNRAPQFAFDDNNMTKWESSDGTKPQWIQVDLGDNYAVNKTMVAFSRLSEWTQYKIEYSINGANWSLFADKTSATDQYGIRIDTGNVTARYLRLTITGQQSNSERAGVFEFKVFGTFVGGNAPVYVAIKAANDKYAAVQSDNYLRANSSVKNDASLYEVIDLGNNIIALRSKLNGKYVHSISNKLLVASRSSITDDGQKFELIRNADGTVSFRSLRHNLYVAANIGWWQGQELIADRTSIGPWEKFRMEQ